MSISHPSTSGEPATIGIRPTGQSPTWRSALLAGLCHIVLLTIAFPPYDVWLLIFFAPIPLALLSLRSHRRIRMAIGVWIPSFLGWLWIYRWMTNVSPLGMVLLAMAMACFSVVFTLMLAVMRPAGRMPVIPGLTCTLLVPIIGTGLEYFRGNFFFTGYPWFFAAHPVIAWPVYCQSADLLGTYFVSFAVLVIPGFLVDLLTIPLFHKGRLSLTFRMAATVFAVVAGANIGYGWFRLAQTNRILGDSRTRPDRQLCIAAIQTDLPQGSKVSADYDQWVKAFGNYKDLTKQAASLEIGGRHPDLIIWPETMVPALAVDEDSVRAMRRAEEQYHITLKNGPQYHDQLLALASQIMTPLLVGSSTAQGLKYVLKTMPDESGRPASFVVPEPEKKFNSSVLFLPGRQTVASIYNKLQLTPFGEVIPYVSQWPSLEQWFLNLGATGMKFDLSPGSKLVRHEIEITRKPSSAGEGTSREVIRAKILVASPICFESTLAPICRELVTPPGEPKADLLANMTNDGWFGNVSGGREQHLQVSRFRCIENRVPMIRAANTGISAAVDSAGRLLREGPNHPQGLPVWNSQGIMLAQVSLDWRNTVYDRIGDVFGAACLIVTIAGLGGAVWRRRRRGRTPRKAKAG